MDDRMMPPAFRYFIERQLTDWAPWYFVGEDVGDAEANAFFAEVFRTETGADFDVRLFARRQDREDFAFFAVRDGKVEDKVVTIHLSFSNRFELKSPLRHADIGQTFLQWIRDVVLVDIEEYLDDDRTFP